MSKCANASTTFQNSFLRSLSHLEPHLTAKEILLVLVTLSYQQSGINASQEQLAQDLNCSAEQVKKLFGSIRKKGWVISNQKKQYSVNTYDFSALFSACEELSSILYPEGENVPLTDAVGDKIARGENVPANSLKDLSSFRSEKIKDQKIDDHNSADPICLPTEIEKAFQECLASKPDFTHPSSLKKVIAEKYNEYQQAKGMNDETFILCMQRFMDYALKGKIVSVAGFAPYFSRILDKPPVAKKVVQFSQRGNNKAKKHTYNRALAPADVRRDKLPELIKAQLERQNNTDLPQPEMTDETRQEYERSVAKINKMLTCMSPGTAV